MIRQRCAACAGLWLSLGVGVSHAVLESLSLFRRRRVKNASHLVCYFRYARFLPDGRLLARTSPEVVARVARWLV